MTMEKKQDMVYDLAKKHFLGDFPDTLPIEKAYLHIGIFMGWIIDNKQYSDFFKKEASTEIFRFSRREISCIILAEIWDGALSHTLFNDETNLFTFYYYAGGIFKRDYIDVLVRSHKTIYHVEDSWENYEKISKRMSERFEEWKKLTQS
ncbi:MAG: hypothetical protein KAI99_07620 [Cyclobacteriaceae bacterium]|nr:hypothetical protein [Cyclobacteriaceae bacterium]MCK5279909.1 hypothetical protein [Cyclobacteriaceae bacterium]MCK5468359.1 hypothetical protein [Cyclobacteriaceae bacterium]